MSDKKFDVPAFPTPNKCFDGLTKREYFAAKALKDGK